MENLIEFNFSAKTIERIMELKFDANSKCSSRVVKLHGGSQKFNGKVMIVALKLKFPSNNVFSNRF